MQNLKSVNIHTLQAHVDAMQRTAEFLAELCAGEILAQRQLSAAELVCVATNLVRVKDDLVAAGNAIRLPEPAGN